MKLKKIIVPGVAAVVGALFGFLFYYFYGCSNGCPMTSNPFFTVGYGGLAGFILFYKK